MDRIKGAGHIANRFVTEDAAGGRPPTEITAEWLNAVQEEIAAVVEWAEIVLSAADDGQLLKAIQKKLQPLDATLTELAKLATVANQIIYSTGEDKFAMTALTAFARTLLDDADAATARETLGAAPLASAALTGTPTAPTQAVGNNSTRLATTAFVQAAVSALVNSSPAALDTLQELAAALGNDANFATTMTNALALKAPLASAALTGTPTAPTQAAGNNSTRLATTAFVQAAVAGFHGQCRLTKSGSNLLLSPFNGNKLLINGAVQIVPAAGVVLASAGLVADTTYFIYAYMNSGVMSLKASTTGHGVDENTGVEIEIGAPARTLVGMARTIAGPTWQDTDSQRFVISWFNRRTIASYKAMSATSTTTSLTPVVVSASDKNEFLTWGDEAVSVKWCGNAYNSASPTQTIANIGIDGALAAGSGTSGSLSNASTPIAVNWDGYLSEGYHYACFIGRVGAASTGSFEVSPSRAELLHAILRG